MFSSHEVGDEGARVDLSDDNLMNVFVEEDEPRVHCPQSLEQRKEHIKQLLEKVFLKKFIITNECYMPPPIFFSKNLL